MVIGVLVGSLAAALMFSESAREVVSGTVRVLFSFFTTPFILETTVALLALFAVLAINKHRLHKEGDGWVYMMVQEGDAKDAGKLPKDFTQRLQGTVMTAKPENVDEALTERSLVEGYLELGMAVQAKQEIERASDLPDEPATLALWVRVLASNLDTEVATERLGNALLRFPDQRPLFSATALEQAMWFRKHLPSREGEAALWQSAAETLARTQPA